MLRFDWSSRKEQLNRRKHGVDFEEAKSVFYDEFAQQFYDDAHSGGEERYIMLGLSRKLRLLVVVHTEEASGQVIRIISARRATAREAKFYRGKGR